MTFDYQGAKKAGYTDKEIGDFIQSENPDFDYHGAVKAGYKPTEIIDFISQSTPQKEKKPERDPVSKAGRIGSQLAMGALEAQTLPYDIGAMALESKEAQNIPLRENIMEDIERLTEQKMTGYFDYKDQERLDSLIDQMKNPRKSMEFAQTGNITTRGIAEKLTGIDLHSEGVAEKVANWLGFIKNPKKVMDLAKTGIKNPKEALKMLMPGTDEVRALGAGAMLQLAEDEKLGPLGTIASAVIGDAAGFGPKGIKYVFQNPQKTAAQITNFFTGSNSKKKSVQDLIKSANEMNIELDAGTLTQSPIVKMIQARLSQSGLTGDALENLRQNLSNQIMREYGSITEFLGDIKFEHDYGMGEAIRDGIQVAEETLQVPKQADRQGRSLVGRVAVQEVPPYETNFLESISPTEFESSLQAGESLKETANSIKEPIKEQFDNAFPDLRGRVAELPPIQAPELVEELRNFQRQQQGSLLLGESTPESKVVEAVNRLINRLDNGLDLPQAIRDINPQLTQGQPVTLQELIKTKQTLGDVANWEFGGSNFQSQFKRLYGLLDQAIERGMMEVAPELLEEWQQLKAAYAGFKDTFENKNVIKLFEPKNNNFTALYNAYLKDPDKLKALEEILNMSPEGQQMLSTLKRDIASRELNKRNLTDRDIRDLNAVLGPEYSDALNEYVNQRRYYEANPGQRAEMQSPLNITIPEAQQATQPIQRGRVKPSLKQEQRKYAEWLSKKKPEQIAKEMDTIEGIRKLQKFLNLTPEGRELFNELKRYKIAKMIDEKMTSSVKENMTVGKFSQLLKSPRERALAKELLGKEAYDKIVKLQKISNKLSESASKFLNTSQSGTTLADMGLISSLMTGVITGNPYLITGSLGYVGGSRVLANLLADPKYLKELEKAILTNDPKKYEKALKAMQPLVKSAMQAAKSGNIPE